MAKAFDNELPRDETSSFAEADYSVPRLAQYALTLLLVALAALFAFIASQFVPTPGLTLIFVLPVITAGAWFGWWPSMVATGTSILVFDFFFTQPYFSLRINDPSEMWAAVLLFITASIVSAVSWQSRRRAFEARRAADQADALQFLAHIVIQGAGQPKIIQAAAGALARILAAPAVVLTEVDRHLRVAAVAGGAELSESEIQAAENALTELTPMRAQMYPHDQSRFDFWPLVRGTERRYVVGVDFSRSAYERPDNPDRFVEIVGAYLTATRAPAGL